LVFPQERLCTQQISFRGIENIGVIAKGERRRWFENIDEIIKESDEIVITRGDMGMYLPALRLL